MAFNAQGVMQNILCLGSAQYFSACTMVNILKTSLFPSSIEATASCQNVLPEFIGG